MRIELDNMYNTNAKDFQEKGIPMSSARKAVRIAVVVFILVSLRISVLCETYRSGRNLPVDVYLDRKQMEAKLLLNVVISHVEDKWIGSIQVVEFRPTPVGDLTIVHSYSYTTENFDFPEMTEFNLNGNALTFNLRKTIGDEVWMKVRLQLRCNSTGTIDIDSLYGSQLEYVRGKENEPHLVEWKTSETPYIELRSSKIF
jgi:hypothetical protein